MGPTTQFCTSDKTITFLFLKTSGNSSYRTFVNGGYIITISPTAIGVDVVPTLKRFRNGTTPGTSQPSPPPRAIPKTIHAVRKRSRNLRRLCVFMGAPILTGRERQGMLTAQCCRVLFSKQDCREL